jgi:NADH:ubiquinone oxidoreductase subunit 3 (subunit A)
MLFTLKQEWFSIFFFFFYSFAISIILFIISLVLFWLRFHSNNNLVKKQNFGVIQQYEKTSPYECGFNPFEESYSRFDIRFYIVAILFIIFDLEVTFLFPWSLVLGFLNVLSFWSMFFFLFILITGFIYEWKRGALDW